MADKVILMKDWFECLKEDPNTSSLTVMDLALIEHAVLHYGFTGEKLVFSEAYGDEYKYLGYIVPNIYKQIDKMKEYADGFNRVTIYDADKIYELRKEGLSAKEICKVLGIPEEKANSLTSNKGWKKACEEIKKEKSDNDNVCGDNESKGASNFDF